MLEVFFEVAVRFAGESNRFQNEGAWVASYPFPSSESVRGFIDGLAGNREAKPEYVATFVSTDGENTEELMRYLKLPTWQEFAVDLRTLATTHLPFTLEAVCDIVEKLYGVTVTRAELRMLEQQ